MALTRNVAYDSPVNVARLTHAFGQNAAGASTAFSKFVAFTNITVYAIAAAAVAVSTSTQTQFNGTGTVVNIAGDQFYGVHVINGAAVSTTTHGPFSLSTGTSTTTTTVGIWTTVALSGTGTTGNVQAGTNTSTGGISLAPGDTFHVLRGTDATAVSAFAIEYSINPAALLTP